MEQYWLWLHALRELSAKSLHQLLAAFGTPECIFYAEKKALCAACDLNSKELAELLRHDLRKAKGIAAQCREKNIHILTMDMPGYPELLRSIPDPPPVLYYIGTFPDFDHALTVAVVGHRQPSHHGYLTARKIGLGLSQTGVIVVSGAAKGIDAAAMEGALYGGSPVVAVLGCGVDIVYPRESRRLLEDVRDYGCILSEFPPGSPPVGWHFLVRNRIISGLSRGVVVVEAPKRSGSLNTARHALEQGRDVFAVPGNAGDAICAGSNDLLRQGAVYAEHAGDILAEYSSLYGEYLHPVSGQMQVRGVAALAWEEAEPLAASPVAFPESAAEKAVDNSEMQPYIDVQSVLPDLPEEEATILQALDSTPVRVDALIEKTGLAAQKVLGALTMLEIKGFVTSHPGGGFSLKRRS